MNELVKLQETKIGLQMPPNMTREEWESYLPHFEMAMDRFRWCFGDYLAFGEQNWGDVYAKVESLTGYSREAVRKIVYVSKWVKYENRIADLSWTHHVMVAGQQPKDQVKWLRLAKENELSVFELKHSINNGRVMKLKDINRASGKDSGFSTIEGLNLWFNRWRNRVNEDHPIETWDISRLDLLKEQLTPMAQLYVKVDRLLTDKRKTNCST